MAATSFANKVPALILRSRFHPMMSDTTLLVTHVGRRSGNRYVTPVNYLDHDGGYVFSTLRPWWRNLASRAPVSVRVRGEELTVRAEVIDDPADAERALAAMVAAQPKYAKRLEVTVVDGVADPDDVRRTVAGDRTFVRLRPTSPHATTSTIESADAHG